MVRPSAAGSPRFALAVPPWATPLFGPREWQVFRRELVAVLDQIGLPYTFLPNDEAVRFGAPGDSEETLCGLGNVAQICHAAGDAARYGEIIATHFGNLPLTRTPYTSPTFEVARPRLKIRLYAQGSLPEGGVLVTKLVAPGLIAALVYDEPELVRQVNVEETRSWPVDLEQLWSIALENVQAEPLETHVGPFPDEQGPAIGVLGSESFFVATWLLLIDQVVGGGHPLGVIVGVPRRHSLLFHSIESDADDFHRSLSVMWSLNRAMFEDGPGSLSPLLYWWRPDAPLEPIFALDLPLGAEGRALAIGLPEGLMTLFGPSPDEVTRPN